MPMTIRQIMSKTPRSRRQAAEWVKITAIKIRRAKSGFPVVLAQTISGHNAAGERKRIPPTHKYITSIEVQNGGKALVSCSCEDFLFTWEFALSKRGAAHVEYSNGDPPIDRNPTLIPGCCKHVYALADKMISEGKL